MDGPSGIAALLEMVAEGVCLSPDHPTAAQVLGFARRFMDAGPPWLDVTALAMRRYAVTTPLEDFGDARQPDEALMIAAELQAALADLALRGAGLWSGKGKQLARRVARQANDASGAFEAVAGRVLEPHGGTLLIGHRLEAPTWWRAPPGVI